MSLSALNSPPLVTAVGAGLLAALPYLEGAVKDVPFVSLKCANFIAYCINFGSVSVPGRIDGGSQADGADSTGKTEMEQLSTESSGRTLVAPSGWYVR